MTDIAILIGATVALVALWVPTILMARDIDRDMTRVIQRSISKR